MLQLLICISSLDAFNTFRKQVSKALFTIWTPLLVDYGNSSMLDVGGRAEGMSAVDLEVVFGSIGRVAFIIGLLTKPSELVFTVHRY
ncbi:hypothetical protein ACQJBY_058637 [Aegilops geniculata]